MPRTILAPTLLALLAFAAGSASRALFAQGQQAEGDDDEGDDAPDAAVATDAHDAGAPRCPAPRTRADREGHCCLPGQRWVAAGCQGAVTSCPPGESLSAQGRCARRGARDAGARAERFEAPAAQGVPRGMAVVPGGVFHAGAVMLEVGPFAIDRAEVTAGAYQACAQAGVCDVPVDPMGQMLRPELPVVNVTHEMAMTYCGWTGGRLPTSAEWLLAARGYEPRRYPWGDRAAECSLARLAGCGDGAAVAGAIPSDRSELGVTEAAGNVSEWVLDGPVPARPLGGVLRDPVGGAMGGRAMVRGGSFLSTSAMAELSRAVFVDAREARIDRGFRCARGL